MMKPLYYDVFNDVTVYEKKAFYYWLGYKIFTEQGCREQITTPSKEILKAIKEGEWCFVKKDDSSFLFEKRTSVIFDFMYQGSVVFWNKFSIYQEGYGWLSGKDFCTPFEERSICHGLTHISERLVNERKLLAKDNLVGCFTEKWS